MELKQKPAVDQSLISTITGIKDVIDYQDGSIVSRTIIKKATGTVTFFAFDKGESLSEHSAPFDALVIVLEGKTEIKISGEPYVLSEGEMIIMPANEPHGLNAMEKFKMLLVMIKD